MRVQISCLFVKLFTIVDTGESERNTGNPTCIGSPPISRNSHGLFQYAPVCCRKMFLSAIGLLFFLCWASTLQVVHILAIAFPKY